MIAKPAADASCRKKTRLTLLQMASHLPEMWYPAKLCKFHKNPLTEARLRRLLDQQVWLRC
jgi:hypothetical protein